jgi:hypothetical protein
MDTEEDDVVKQEMIKEEPETDCYQPSMLMCLVKEEEPDRK